jgi:methylated-DNA-[protein]-cysteine S-methyltransferase
MTTRVIATLIGDLTVTAHRQYITSVRFGKFDYVNGDEVEIEVELLNNAEKQLGEYFSRTRNDFDLLLELDGTEFQRAAWQRCARIPCGETITYGQLAADIGRPKAARAVGMAMHDNPIVIIVPCHRVVGSTGSLTGFGGGLDMKKWLLEHERVICMTKG